MNMNKDFFFLIFGIAAFKANGLQLKIYIFKIGLLTLGQETIVLYAVLTLLILKEFRKQFECSTHMNNFIFRFRLMF